MHGPQVRYAINWVIQMQFRLVHLLVLTALLAAIAVWLARWATVPAEVEIIWVYECYFQPS